MTRTKRHRAEGRGASARDTRRRGRRGRTRAGSCSRRVGAGDFHGADVRSVAAIGDRPEVRRPRQPTLIGEHAERRARVDDGAAGGGQQGLRRTAVVGQRTQLRIGRERRAADRARADGVDGVHEVERRDVGARRSEVDRQATRRLRRGEVERADATGDDRVAQRRGRRARRVTVEDEVVDRGAVIVGSR